MPQGSISGPGCPPGVSGQAQGQCWSTRGSLTASPSLTTLCWRGCGGQGGQHSLGPPSRAPSCTPGPPSMQVTIEDVQAQRGSTAQFQAVIEGNPQPTVTWYRVRTGTLWGAGLGECVAFPPYSKALTGGWDRLPCRGPQVGLMSTRLCPQDDAQLVDGARLSQQQEGTTYSLVLRDVTQDDAGVYTCLARNAGGQVLCKAELVVHGGESGDPSQNPSVCSSRARGGVCGLSRAPAQGCYTCAGDSEPDSGKQSYRRKLHSFYEVKEEIGRYGPVTQTQEPLPALLELRPQPPPP